MKTRKNKKKHQKTKKHRQTERIKTLRFKDYPDFKPNLTPRQIFKMGSFGGTYWRPIFSRVTNKKYKNQHKKFPASWWKGIPDEHLTKPFDKYDTSINKYGEKVGTTLQFWEERRDGLMNKIHMVGYSGIAIFTMDGEAQMMKDKFNDGNLSRERKGVFSGWLKTLIKNKKGKYDDADDQPKNTPNITTLGIQINCKRL